MVSEQRDDVPGPGKILLLAGINALGIFTLTLLLLGSQWWQAAGYGLAVGVVVLGYLFLGRRRALRQQPAQPDRSRSQNRSRARK
ncbi:MAG: hypothetical protein KDC39_04425 [Actinobacteria bacterium]|nr:hypothetical protein [Actinomycetota bacterium]